MTETKTYRGWLDRVGNGEEHDLLGVRPTGIGGDSYILAEQVDDDMASAGDFLSVRYFITDREVSADELATELANVATGEADVLYGMRYSELTGYLWTDEDLKVGGHDLLAELKSHLGKFLHMEIVFAKTADALFGEQEGE